MLLVFGGGQPHQHPSGVCYTAEDIKPGFLRDVQPDLEFKGENEPN